MKKISFLLLLLALSCVIYSCKSGNTRHTNTNATIEKPQHEYELKFVAFKVYNESRLPKQNEARLNLFKHMRMAIIEDTLIINDDNKITFSVQQADSKQFYNHRHGISNFYATELNKLGYKSDSNTITFLKPEDYIRQETWNHNYIDMLGLGVVAGKYIFFPCILTDNGEENAMLIYEMPQGVKLSKTADSREDNDESDSIKVAETSSDKFFEGKDINIGKLGIDTTKIMFSDYSLPKENSDNITDKVETIIINGKKQAFKDYISTSVNAIFPLPSYQGHDIFIIAFEYGDSEYWEMCISDKGIINGESQRMTVRYTWDDWGDEDEKNADYNTINFQIYPNYIICLKGEKREKGKIKKRRRYYRINSKGRFEEII